MCFCCFEYTIWKFGAEIQSKLVLQLSLHGVIFSRLTVGEDKMGNIIKFIMDITRKLPTSRLKSPFFTDCVVIKARPFISNVLNYVDENKTIRINVVKNDLNV